MNLHLLEWNTRFCGGGGRARTLNLQREHLRPWEIWDREGH